MSALEVNFSSPADEHIPLVIHPGRPSGLIEWLADRSDLCNDLLLRHKALLFRGFDTSEECFPEIVKCVCTPIKYLYRSTPRTQVASNVYTATEYPANQSIPQHNEEAYQLHWPMRLVFFCAQPAAEGGETPIADNVRITQLIDREIIEKFRKKKVMYVRNYGSGIDLSWQTVFQTTEKAMVEEFCKLNQIEFEWKSDECLRTRQICQAVADHPVTGQTLWFNQAHLFHVSSLDRRTQQALLSIYKEDELPRNAYYGDGSHLEPNILDHVRRAYDSESVPVNWQVGDVLLLDNMLASHGRRPFKGKRRVLAAMGDSYCDVRAKVQAACCRPNSSL